MKRNGFTVNELTVALMLIGIVLAIASPRVKGALERTATRVAADEFMTTHMLARSVAVRYGRTAELHIDVGAGRFWVEADTSANGGSRDTVGPIKRLSEKMVTLTSDRAVLCFDARGFPSTRGACEAADATLTFSQAGNVDTLKITALGKVLR
jgi:prepilin-type N-terminal cleavage/methylation domain-containing protein